MLRYIHIFANKVWETINKVFRKVHLTLFLMHLGQVDHLDLTSGQEYIQ